jgi:hypothetical protein
MIRNIFNKLLRFIIKNWVPILIIIIGLFPILFFKDNLLLSANEGIKNLDINNYYKYYDWYAWRERHSPGKHNVWIPHLIIYNLFFYTFSFLGFALKSQIILWYIFLWIASGLAIYYLIKIISGGHNYKLWGFLTAFLYLFNTFTMIKHFEENFRLVYIGLPLMLAFFIKGLKKIKKNTYYSVLMGLTSLIFASSSVNPPAVSIVWITVSFYFCFDIIEARKIKLKKIFFLIKILFFYILFNLWWMASTVPGMIAMSSDFEKSMRFSSLRTTLYEIYRFLGMWAFKAGHQGVNYFPYYPLYYNNKLVIFFSFFIIIIAFSALFFKKQKNKFITFFAALAVISIFLIKGTSEPFGDLFKFLWENVPGLWVFREPYTKFTPMLVFAISILFGYTVYRFLEKISLLAHKGKKKLSWMLNLLLISLVIFTVCVAAFPIFTRRLFREESHMSMKSQYFNFPDYWLDVGYWFRDNDKNSRVLVLPKASYGVPYDWENGYSSAGPVTALLIPNPFLTNRDPVSEGEKIVNLLFDQINPDARADLVKFMRLLGIKYILQQNDVDWQVSLKDTYSPEIMKEILEKQEGIKLFKQFGRIDIYKIKDDYFLPLVYSPEEIICTEKSNDLIAGIAFKGKATTAQGIFFGEEICRKDLLSLGWTEEGVDELIVPKIDFKKISPAKYKVKITNAKESFLLTLSTNFHPHWKIYIKENSNLNFSNNDLNSTISETWFKKPSLEEDSHFTINGYANTWWMDLDKLEKEGKIKKTASGNYNFTMIIEYWSQKLILLGGLASGLTLIFSLFYLSKNYHKK